MFCILWVESSLLYFLRWGIRDESFHTTRNHFVRPLCFFGIGIRLWDKVGTISQRCIVSILKRHLETVQSVRQGLVVPSHFWRLGSSVTSHRQMGTMLIYIQRQLKKVLLIKWLHFHKTENFSVIQELVQNRWRFREAGLLFKMKRSKF